MTPAAGTVAYFDCRFGAAGDMLTAALLDCGIDLDAWQREVAKIALPPGSYSLTVKRVLRQALAASKLDVCDEHGGLMDAEPGQHEHHEHRNLAEIEAILQRSPIAAGAKELAVNVFRRLARAEGQVHGVAPEAVQFHEVGAVDAIVDITGFAIAYDMLAISRAIVSALSLGGGMIKSAHGMYPAPGPAVVNLLREAGAATTGLDIDFECLTPTGAAILCEIAASWGKAPALAPVLAAGCGAGTKDTAGWPNVCRVLIGRAPDDVLPTSQRFDQDSVCVIEANIDDASPQVLAHAMDKLVAAGALDVTVVPALMKKGRSGHIVSVLANPGDVACLQDVLFAETTTIGLRVSAAERALAVRSWQEVELADGGRVRIKLACDRRGQIVNVQPEYEDCRRHAEASGRPLKEILSEALVQFSRQPSSMQVTGAQERPAWQR